MVIKTGSKVIYQGFEHTVELKVVFFSATQAPKTEINLFIDGSYSGTLTPTGAQALHQVGSLKIEN